MRTPALGILSAALAGLAACETAPPDPAAGGAPVAERCFNVRSLSGFDTVDRDTLRLRAGADRYEVDLSGPECDRLEWTHGVAVEASPSSLWICAGDQAGQGVIAFRVPETRRVVECRINAVRTVADGRPAA